ncbi:MAG: hypothetical protein FWF49_04565, partial [Oscillospiraceae bacterium]|nr:hypothetical protein [Oscillospiraceae bacterium]
LCFFLMLSGNFMYGGDTQFTEYGLVIIAATLVLTCFWVILFRKIEDTFARGFYHGLLGLTTLLGFIALLYVFMNNVEPIRFPFTGLV